MKRNRVEKGCTVTFRISDPRTNDQPKVLTKKLSNQVLLIHEFHSTQESIEQRTTETIRTQFYVDNNTISIDSKIGKAIYHRYEGSVVNLEDGRKVTILKIINENI